jgi:hypothetical protein
MHLNLMFPDFSATSPTRIAAFHSPNYVPLVTLIYASNRAADCVRRYENGGNIMAPDRGEIADREASFEAGCTGRVCASGFTFNGRGDFQRVQELGLTFAAMRRR